MSFPCWVAQGLRMALMQASLAAICVNCLHKLRDSGIVRAIGSAEHHTDVLANPNLISQAVLRTGLDVQTSFEIVSIDIAEIDVGENVGAQLQANQAAADLRVAQAKAEERRAAAVATEQEMKALVEENRAKVILAEAQIPLAISEAFRNGRLGVSR